MYSPRRVNVVNLGEPVPPGSIRTGSDPRWSIRSVESLPLVVGPMSYAGRSGLHSLSGERGDRPRRHDIIPLGTDTGGHARQPAVEG